jgi:hypothetical protein
MDGTERLWYTSRGRSLRAGLGRIVPRAGGVVVVPSVDATVRSADFRGATSRDHDAPVPGIFDSRASREQRNRNELRGARERETESKWKLSQLRRFLALTYPVSSHTASSIDVRDQGFGF